MSRKITIAITLTLLLTTAAFADGRVRSVGRGSDFTAALLPISAPGTVVSGIVSSVNGSIIALAGGLVTIDASQAKISNDRGGSASIDTITPGSLIVAILSSSNVAANAPLPAMLIGVTRIPQVTLTGPVQSVGTNTITVLGRTIAVDANTSFGGRTRGLADVLVNDVVQVQANNVNGVLVASAILAFAPPPKPATVIHGTVKTIGPDVWVITDRANKDWTVLVNAQTRIAGDPKVGDEVEILANVDNANQYTALSIFKSIRIEPVTILIGEVKSIGPASWTIRDSRSNREITVAVNSQTKITGNPRVNDGVQVTATVDAAGNHTALLIVKLGIVPPLPFQILGVVTEIAGPACVSCGDPAVWTIAPHSGLGPNLRVQVSSLTKITGNPRIGDSVEVMAFELGNGVYSAVSIAKK